MQASNNSMESVNGWYTDGETPPNPIDFPSIDEFQDILPEQSSPSIELQQFQNVRKLVNRFN